MSEASAMAVYASCIYFCFDQSETTPIAEVYDDQELATIPTIMVIIILWNCTVKIDDLHASRSIAHANTKKVRAKANKLVDLAISSISALGTLLPQSQ
jgi:hypothetical protein